ncbi:MAG: ABC transporter substrate-binding protein [Acidimicrobiales bacterium]
MRGAAVVPWGGEVEMVGWLKRCGLFGAVVALVVGLGPALAGAVASTVSIPGVKAIPIAAKPKHGGSMTVLLGSGLAGSWTNLNSVGNPEIFNGGFYDAIYGTLFGQLYNGKIVPQLATGYKYSDGGRTFTITLRKGVTFSDGTPFNSAAVLENWKLDITPGSVDAASYPIASMSAPGPYTLVMNLTHPDGAILDAFPDSSPNWIASPTHLASLKSPTATDLLPVGAGPFKVVSDTPNVQVTMARNPSYWDQPYPYLNKIVFKSVANDSSALAAIQTGEAQVYGGYGEYQNVRSIVNSVDVYGGARVGTNAEDLQFNMQAAPFNNIAAREAIAYATNPEAINKALYASTATLTESPLGPGSPFWEQKVPGYRAYNLKKAKALVKQLGGSLNVTLLSLNDLVTQETDEALQSQWAQAGIHTTIEAKDQGTYIQNVLGGKWQTEIADPGSYDPAVGFGMAFDFGSKGILSGVRDAHLDALIEQASEPLDQKTRIADYDAIYKYISDNEYGVMLYIPTGFTLTAKNVTFSTQKLGLFAPPLQSYYETLAYTNSKT